MRGFIVAIPLVCLSLVSPAVSQTSEPLPGMPPVLDPHDVYSANHPNRLNPVVRGFPERVYVPNSGSNTVDVIDPKTFKIVDHFGVGALPQHVTPSWDLKTLYVLNDQGNSLTTINPLTGKPGRTIAVRLLPWSLRT